jgi:hypothetical protein
MGIMSSIEGLVAKHPFMAAALGAFAGHKIDGHGVLRSSMDGLATYEEAKGKAGLFSKVVMAEDAREAAVKVAEKAGGGWLAKEFAGIAAFAGAYHEAGVVSKDIQSRKPGPEGAGTKQSSLVPSLLRKLLPTMA